MKRLMWTPARLAAFAIAIATGLFAQVIGHIPLLSLCVATVTFAMTLSAVSAWQNSRELSDGREVPMYIESIYATLAGGSAFTEALANLVNELPDGQRVKAEELAAAFDSDVTLEQKILSGKRILGSREGDLLFELVLVAARNGDDRLVAALRQLATDLRAEQGLVLELKSRQGWVLGSARLALAAPWVVVLLLAVRPETAQAFQSQTGAIVLLTGVGLSFVAQRFIAAGAKLPNARRIFEAVH